MPRRKPIVHCMNKTTASSSCSTSDDYDSLNADQEQTPETQAATLDASSLSTMPSR